QMQTQLIRLRREMKEAVATEDYERASGLRDQIRQIEIDRPQASAPTDVALPPPSEETPPACRAAQYPLPESVLQAHSTPDSPFAQSNPDIIYGYQPGRTGG